MGLHHLRAHAGVQPPVVAHGGVVDDQPISEPVVELQGQLRLVGARQIARQDAAKFRADGLPVVQDRADEIAQIPDHGTGKGRMGGKQCRWQHRAGDPHGGDRGVDHRQGALAQAAQILHGNQGFHRINSFPL